MTQTQARRPWALTASLLVVGAAAAGAAFWLIDHRAAVRDSGVVIAVFLGLYFTCWTWALLRYLRWRDAGRPVAAVRTAYREEEVEGTIYGLIPGGEYRVMQPFADFHGNQFRQGEVLRFKERHFLPYHGGHTVVFEGRSLYLQEEQNAEILANFSQYLTRAGRRSSA
jgi:hypothetical protein